MITHQNGLLVATVRAAVPAADADQERTRLRRELLRRIMDRETRRRILRAASR